MQSQATALPSTDIWKLHPTLTSASHTTDGVLSDAPQIQTSIPTMTKLVGQLQEGIVTTAGTNLHQKHPKSPRTLQHSNRASTLCALPRMSMSISLPSDLELSLTSTQRQCL
jgi:hypothetical protein